MTGTELTVVVGVVMLLGLLGVAVPLLPGLALIAAAALWWTLADGPSAGHWVVFAVIVVVWGVGFALKYAVPAKRTTASGAVGSSLLLAALLGVVGLFVIPVIGAPVGFVLGIYLAELRRQRSSGAAWRSTKAALTGIALGMLIEFCAGALMIGVWVLGLILV
ncbi:DUF456 family protein [Nakamurella aerolata]|uniref:DUF456 family protein n=1 Tax=Nakamurella aerolata TaxID=1656892 RepID=UPI001BB1D439